MTPEAIIAEMRRALEAAYSKLAKMSHPETRYEDRIMSNIRAALAHSERYLAAEREMDEARTALKQAMPILEAYARSNPIHFSHDPKQAQPVRQDPNGVHALLKALRVREQGKEQAND